MTSAWTSQIGINPNVHIFQYDLWMIQLLRNTTNTNFKNVSLNADHVNYTEKNLSKTWSFTNVFIWPRNSTKYEIFVIYFPTC